MRLIHLEVQSLLGFEHLSADIGRTLTVITGGNEKGKTSTIEAVRSALKGGTDATLIRNGQPGKSVLVFDNGQQLVRDYAPDGSSKAKIQGPDGKALKGITPSQWLASITSERGLNPLLFIRPGVPMKDRLRWVLEAMPLRVTREQLEAAGVDQIVMATVDFEQHALVVLDSLAGDKSGYFYDQRTGVNARKTSKLQHARELKEAMGEAAAPPAVPLETLRERYRAVDRQCGEELAALDAKTAQRVREVESGMDQAAAAVKAKAARLIARIEAAKEKKLREISEMRSESLASIGFERAPEREALILSHTEKLQAIREEARAAEVAQKRYEDAERSRQRYEEAIREAEGLDSEASRLTDVIEGVRDLKKSITSKLPVDGLEIRDGALYIDGVHLERVNTAKAVRKAMAVARLNIKPEFPFLCVDGLECLDDESWTELQQAAEASSIQLMVTRVSRRDEPLTITSVA